MEVRRCIEKKRKRFGQEFTRINAKQKGKDLEMLYRGMIRNVMLKTNDDIIGEQCIRNDDDVLAVQGQDTKIAWISLYEREAFKHKGCLR